MGDGFGYAAASFSKRCHQVPVPSRSPRFEQISHDETEVEGYDMQRQAFCRVRMTSHRRATNATCLATVSEWIRRRFG